MVKIFNEKQVDELVVFDIDATVFKKEPNYSLIKKLNSQSMMPLCVGRCKTVEQAQKIFSLGIEKKSIEFSTVLENPGLITEI